jgi:hypothetical protein
VRLPFGGFTFNQQNRESLDMIARRLVDVKSLEEEEFDRVSPVPQPNRSGPPTPR